MSIAIESSIVHWFIFCTKKKNVGKKCSIGYSGTQQWSKAIKPHIYRAVKLQVAACNESTKDLDRAMKPSSKH